MHCHTRMKRSRSRKVEVACESSDQGDFGSVVVAYARRFEWCDDRFERRL